MTADTSAPFLAAFDDAVATRPHDVAVYHRARWGRYAHVTFGELGRRCDDFAESMVRAGLRQGMRACLMVRPGPDMIALYLAMARLGVVAVLVDPRMGQAALRACLAEAAPEAFVGEPLAHVARVLLGWGRRSVRLPVTAGRRWFWGGHRVRTTTSPPPRPAVEPDAVTSVAYTSGSTGVPKGVEFRARHTHAQFRMARELLPAHHGEVVLSGFPPFAMAAPVGGGQLVLPTMDLRQRPAFIDPAVIVAELSRFGVTSLFGSPAFLDVLSRHVERTGASLRSVRVVVSAGATLDPRIAERLRRCLPEQALLYSAYGATECLPVSVIESRELLGEARRMSERGAGSCVGLPHPENTVRVIGIHDGPITAWDDRLLVPSGVVGEIIVAGPSVSDRYLNRPQATQEAKIGDGGRIVHRTGDLGWLDAQGRLWYCGRKSQRVGDLCTEQVEPIANTVSGVRRSALVDVAGPVLCVELERDVTRRGAVLDDVRAVLSGHDHTRDIRRVLRHPGFPVDVRHNSKIERDRLARWARRVGSKGEDA